MSTIELKHNLHQLIDSIDNEAMLTTVYSFMSTIRDTKDGMLWSRLTKEEQEELLLSDLESEEPNNLKVPKKPKAGCAKGLITISDDFDEPLEDFREYM